MLVNNEICRYIIRVPAYRCIKRNCVVSSYSNYVKKIESTMYLNPIDQTFR